MAIGIVPPPCMLHGGNNSSAIVPTSDVRTLVWVADQQSNENNGDSVAPTSEVKAPLPPADKQRGDNKNADSEASTSDDEDPLPVRDPLPSTDHHRDHNTTSSDTSHAGDPTPPPLYTSTLPSVPPSPPSKWPLPLKQHAKLIFNGDWNSPHGPDHHGYSKHLAWVKYPSMARQLRKAGDTVGSAVYGLAQDYAVRQQCKLLLWDCAAGRRREPQRPWAFNAAPSPWAFQFHAAPSPWAFTAAERPWTFHAAERPWAYHAPEQLQIEARDPACAVPATEQPQTKEGESTDPVAALKEQQEEKERRRAKRRRIMKKVWHGALVALAGVAGVLVAAIVEEEMADAKRKEEVAGARREEEVVGRILEEEAD